MSARDDDRRLRELFDALREEDRRALPTFDRMTVHSTERPRATGRPPEADRLPTPRWIWATAALLAAALVTAVVQVRSSRQAGHDRLAEALHLAREMGSWEAPTDVVLEIDLLEIPDRVPSLEFDSIALPSMTATEPDAGSEAGGPTPYLPLI